MSENGFLSYVVTELNKSPLPFSAASASGFHEWPGMKKPQSSNAEEDASKKMRIQKASRYDLAKMPNKLFTPSGAKDFLKPEGIAEFSLRRLMRSGASRAPDAQGAVDGTRAMGAWPDNPPPDRQTSRLPEEADHLRLPGRGGHPLDSSSLKPFTST